MFSSRSEAFKISYDKGVNLWNELKENAALLPMGTMPTWENWEVYSQPDANFLSRFAGKCAEDGILFSLDEVRESSRDASENICSNTYQPWVASSTEGRSSKIDSGLYFKNWFSPDAGSIVADNNIAVVRSPREPTTLSSAIIPASSPHSDNAMCRNARYHWNEVVARIW